MKDVTIIKSIFKFIISAASAIVLTFGSISVSAQEITNITLLGDSITTGYGLSEDELSYGDYLESYFNADIENFAVDGFTTQNLIDKLEEQDVVSSIENADLICISIGGNDFLSIFQTALSEVGGISISSDGQPNINVSSEFVSKFIMDYSSAFADAAVQAGENILQIKDTINNINPDAEIIMQTVYNPLESSNEEMNKLMSPIKTFASLYMTAVNNSIKEASPNTADIYLKFSEKAYLYTNIDSYDIHPNFIGHMLIAEEIIQTLASDGDFTVFTDTIYNLPQGVFSEFPQYTSDELTSFAQKHLRRGTLEQSIQRTASASVQETTEENSQETNVTETEATKTSETKKTSKTNKILSRVFLILGFSIIILVTFLKFVRERKKNR